MDNRLPEGINKFIYKTMTDDMPKSIEEAFDSVYNKQNKFYTDGTVFGNYLHAMRDTDKFESEVEYVLQKLEDTSLRYQIKYVHGYYMPITNCMSINRMMKIAIRGNYFFFAKYLILTFFDYPRLGTKNVRRSVMKKFYNKFHDRLFRNTKRNIREYVSILNSFNHYIVVNQEDYDFVIDCFCINPKKYKALMTHLHDNGMTAAQRERIDAMNVLLSLGGK